MASAAWTAAFAAGFIALAGAIAGRFACGWVCPFGLLQELLFFGRGRSLPRSSLYAKYAVLALLVVILPLFVTATPSFCKFVCPAGTIEAGLPLVGYDRIEQTGQFAVGALFAWKVALAAGILAGIVLFSRFFCRTVCPLGAAWGLFNGVSLVALEVDKSACTRCGFCRTVCPMDIGIFEGSGSAECIRCLECLKCPSSAVKVVLRGAIERGGARRERVLRSSVLGDGL